VRSFRWGDRPYQVRVIAGERSVTVTVVSFCACGGTTVIDLSPWAFSKLAPLSAGLVRVRVLR
jgi:rare lipoprotein A (peptidoglycan hydrolase)